ncbi:hypothetical protein D3C72_1106370 [compost metagenome]
MLTAFSSPKSLPGNISTVLVPIALMSSRILRRDPSPSATTDTTAAMPMMMPSIVREVRSRWAFMASSAMRSASPQRSR